MVPRTFYYQSEFNWIFLSDHPLIMIITNIRAKAPSTKGVGPFKLLYKMYAVFTSVLQGKRMFTI